MGSNSAEDYIIHEVRDGYGDRGLTPDVLNELTASLTEIAGEDPKPTAIGRVILDNDPNYIGVEP